MGFYLAQLPPSFIVSKYLYIINCLLLKILRFYTFCCSPPPLLGATEAVALAGLLLFPRSLHLADDAGHGQRAGVRDAQQTTVGEQRPGGEGATIAADEIVADASRRGTPTDTAGGDGRAEEDDGGKEDGGGGGGEGRLLLNKLIIFWSKLTQSFQKTFTEEYKRI